MISHRKYFSMLMMMGLLLFMFMFTQIAKESLSNYGVNDYAQEEAVSGGGRWRPLDSCPDGEPAYTSVPEEGTFVLLFGQGGSAVGRVASQWCTYTKRELVICGRLEDYAPDPRQTPEIVLVDPGVVDCAAGEDYLLALAGRGVHMVFCSLPDPAVIREQEGLRALLGIQTVLADRIEVEGIHLFGDFFLGGSYIYRVEREEDEERQDLQLEIPWYVTLTGTKTYMVGILDELLEGNEAKNEFFPPVIWRNSYGGAKIFAVNGDYMSDMTGIGILSAVSYELEPYALYPVVNAQNLVMTDYPCFADENAEAMAEIYSRTPRAVQQDVIWPTLLGVLQRGGWKLTGFFSPQYDYQDGIEPSAGDVQFYLQQFKEVGAEAGVSLRHGDTVELPEKLERDGAFYRETDPAYVYSAAYVDGPEFRALDGAEGAGFLSGVRTAASEYRTDTPMVFYYSDGVTGQSIIGDARTHTYSENVRLRSIETALGYSCVKIDVHEVLWPESDDTHWEKLFSDLSGNLDTWWKPFSAFEKTTLTQSDGRVRAFLNLDYTHRREGGRVYLDVEGMEDDGWFLLRTHGEDIADITGADWQAVEENAYLLHITQDHVEIRLEKNRGILKYTMPENG